MKNIFFLKLSPVPITIPDHDPRFFFKNCPTSRSRSPITLLDFSKQRDKSNKSRTRKTRNPVIPV